MSPVRRPRRKRPGLSQSPAVWVSARARNALRRPALISGVSIIVFAASLLALIIVPQQARRAATALRPAATLRPDTESTAAALTLAERELASADSSLVLTRGAYAQMVAATAAAAAADTTAGGALVAPAVRARRDTLLAQARQLSMLVAHAADAPLLGTYRILAQAAPMQADARVKPLLDSLVDIERQRDSYTAVGGVDPVFVSLTARANELGRNLAALAEARRQELVKEASTLAPPVPAKAVAVAAQPMPDTMAAIRERDDARTAEGGVSVRLARERHELAMLDAREERARELSNVGASPTAVLAAALVFATVIGFGVAFFAEVRHPRVAELEEVERLTGVKVFGIVKPIRAHPARRRRAADKTAPRYMDSGGDGHQLVYLNVATAGTSAVMLTVTSDVPGVAAIVAVNFAAIAADEARATLLVDTDPALGSVSKALRMRPGEGFAGIVRGRADWNSATKAVRLGRDRVIDVVEAGTGSVSNEDVGAALSREAAQLSRRYDALVLVSGLGQVTGGISSNLPVTDVIVCARAGQTQLAGLEHTVAAIREAGATPRGIVIWDAPVPSFGKARAVEEVAREAEPAVAV